METRNNNVDTTIAKKISETKNKLMQFSEKIAAKEDILYDIYMLYSKVIDYINIDTQKYQFLVSIDETNMPVHQIPIEDIENSLKNIKSYLENLYKSLISGNENEYGLYDIIGFNDPLIKLVVISLKDKDTPFYSEYNVIDITYHYFVNVPSSNNENAIVYLFSNHALCLNPIFLFNNKRNYFIVNVNHRTVFSCKDKFDVLAAINEGLRAEEYRKNKIFFPIDMFLNITDYLDISFRFKLK